MKTIERTLRGAALAAALALLAPPAQALMVSAIAEALGGGVFHYSFSVNNDDPDDYAIVSIVDAPTGDPLIDASLITPTGFLASYDGGLGIVDFLADTADFVTGTTVGPFAFDSTSDPAVNFLTFEALTLTGNPVSGDVTIIPVPGAGGLIVLAVALGLLAAGRRIVPAGAVA
jgi:hypothetical protein